MLNLIEIEKLASQILYHKKLYYSGKSILADAEYDILEEKLRQASPEHPVLNYVGYSLDEKNNKVKHEIPMLSLAKTYSAKDLFDFINKYPCIAVDKFDGMALSIEYDEQGNLSVASTRGNGKLGENVTEHVYHILAIPKKLRFPSGWNKNVRLEIRGEIYFPKSEFLKYEEQFDSFRNAVPGTLNRKEVHDSIGILNCFAFCPYDIIGIPKSLNVTDYLEKIKFIKQIGFNFDEHSFIHVPSFIQDESKLNEYLTEYYERPRDYIIDGIVFRIRDENTWEFLGNTAHHPRGSLAFKKAGETAATEILSIEESIGRSGKITFRAKLKPVSLSGATISYASLHNAEYIEQGHYSEGAKVKIIRSGEVIPAIIELIEPSPIQYKLPQYCKCGFKLVRQGPDLMCLEKLKCPYKDQESLVYFVSSLDMNGISDKIIFKIRQAGLLNEPADLYKISIEDLLQIEGFAQKSAENVNACIQNSKKIPLAKFLTALGLKRGGVVKCQEVAKKFVSLKNVLQIKEEDLTSDKGWAEKSAQDFVSSLADKHVIIENLLHYVEVLDDTSLNETLQYAAHPYYKKNICITGSLSKPREEYKFLLEKVGAKLVSSVSSKTDFLVCNEESSSSKYKEAKKLGVPVMKEDEFSAAL